MLAHDQLLFEQAQPSLVEVTIDIFCTFKWRWSTSDKRPCDPFKLGLPGDRKLKSSCLPHQLIKPLFNIIGTRRPSSRIVVRLNIGEIHQLAVRLQKPMPTLKQAWSLLFRKESDEVMRKDKIHRFDVQSENILSMQLNLKTNLL